jgi:SNF2 family DNA or RNA helicase
MIGGYSPEAVLKPMHGYQQKVAYWTLGRIFEQDELGAGVFLDPGLGKTRTTLSVLDFLFQIGAIRKALIVGPLRPIYSVWPNEIKRWGFPQTYQILHGKTARNLKSDAQIELMNYGSLHKIADLENRWDVIVLDESTYIKNWSTNRTKNIKKLAKSIPSRVLLTGTPASNSLADLFAQMYIIDGGQALGKTVGGFRRNFCRPAGQQQWNKWVVKKVEQVGS